MRNKVIRIGKEIAEQITISFFVSSIVVLVIFFGLSDKINNALSVLNMITISEKQIEQQEVSFDSVKKRLAVYPLWGTVWATLEIPDIGINIPVYQGDTLDIIQYGAGHFSGSYFPGEGGSVVLAAHNSRQPFMHLPHLDLGATIIVHTNYGTFTYELTDTKVIRDNDMASIPIQADEEI